MRGICPRCMSAVTDRYIATVNIFRYQIRPSSKKVQDFTETEYLQYCYLQTYERALKLNSVYQRLYGWYARVRPLKDPLMHAGYHHWLEHWEPVWAWEAWTRSSYGNPAKSKSPFLFSVWDFLTAFLNKQAFFRPDNGTRQ